MPQAKAVFQKLNNPKHENIKPNFRTSLRGLHNTLIKYLHLIYSMMPAPHPRPSITLTRTCPGNLLCCMYTGPMKCGPHTPGTSAEWLQLWAVYRAAHARPCGPNESWAAQPPHPRAWPQLDRGPHVKTAPWSRNTLGWMTEPEAVVVDLSINDNRGPQGHGRCLRLKNWS